VAFIFPYFYDDLSLFLQALYFHDLCQQLFSPIRASRLSALWNHPLPQWLKPLHLAHPFGTAKAVPFQSSIRLLFRYFFISG
jgi:hypothetical protein